MLNPMTNEERTCFEVGMSQWERSLKRPDLCEKDRVAGALLAYQRQAFAYTILPSEAALASPAGVVEPVADYWTTNNNFENGCMTGIGLVGEKGEPCWDFAKQEWSIASVPVYAHPPQQEPARLREAAKAVIDRWDTPLWKDVEPTAAVIARLRAALAEDGL